MLPDFLQWICISFIMRGGKRYFKTKVWKRKDWIKGHFSLGSNRPIMLLTPCSDLGEKSVVCLLTIPWLQVDQSQVTGILKSLIPVQALKLCHTRGFLASQNHLSPSLTLSSSAIAMAQESINTSRSLPLSPSLSFPLPPFPSLSLSLYLSPSSPFGLKFFRVKDAFLLMPHVPGSWGMVQAFSSLLMAILRPWCSPSPVQCLLLLLFTPCGYITLYLSWALGCVDFQVTLHIHWEFIYVSPSHTALVQNNSFHCPRQL